MVLATNVKKFKYSLVFKFICIFLSCAFTLGACYTVGAVTTTLANNAENGEESLTDWTASSTVSSKFSEYALGIYAQLWKQPAKLSAQLDSQKKSACDAVYAKIVSAYKASTGEPKAKDIINVYEDFVPYDVSTDFSAEIDTGEFDFSNIFDFSNYDYARDVEYEKLYSEVESAYDEFSHGIVVDYKGDTYSYFDDDIYYIAKKDGKIDDQNTTLNEEELMTGCYIAVKDGKVISNGVADETVESLKTNIGEKYISDKSTELYLKINEDPSSSLMNYRDFTQRAQKINENITGYIVLSIVLAAAAIAFAVMYFCITGRKNETDPAKLAFTDYIPLELQLAAAGGLGFGAFLLFMTAISDIDMRFIFIVLSFLALCFAFWLLLFMQISSIVRYAKSDKKFYKHLLIYWIFWIIFKFFSAVFKRIRKTNKKLAATISTLKYKPRQMKKQAMLLAAAFIFGNLLAAALIVICALIASWDHPTFVFLDILLIIGVIAADVFSLNKIAKYIKSLDIIIDACSRHVDVPLDVEALPSSLRVLTESMKYTNAELQSAITKAVKDERLRAELITNVSHDLKTPLSSIITYVDLLQSRDIQDEKAREYINVLDEKGAKLKRLIDDLIEASKITSGSVKVNLTPVNLSELCLQSTVDVQSDFEKNNLSLVVKQGEKPVTVIADGSKAFRVVENLLSNARKYSAKGTRVYVSVYEKDGKGVFEIKNISAQQLDITPDELTERFVRGDKSRNQEGNGLGLSIAKELCKVQNGELALSIDGDLFKATVSFPLK